MVSDLNAHHRLWDSACDAHAADAVEDQVTAWPDRAGWMVFNQWRRHGEGASGATYPPPPTSDRTPREIDADPRRFSCPKKGVGLQDLL